MSRSRERREGHVPVRPRDDLLPLRTLRPSPPVLRPVATGGIRRRLHVERSVRLGRHTQVTLRMTTVQDTERICALWIVSVDDDVYVRALSGVRTWWYRQVAAPSAAAQVWCADGMVHARFEPVPDLRLPERIDAACAEKYGLGWPGPVGFITAPVARAATLRVVRAAGTSGRRGGPSDAA